MLDPKREKTRELIQTLSRDISAKGHLNSKILFLSWTGLLVSGIMLGYAVSLARHQSVFPGWWPEPTLILAWGLLTAILLTKSAYPEEGSAWLFWGAGASVFVWIGFHTVGFVNEFQIEHVHIGFCPLVLVSCTILFGGLSWILLGRMASARPGLSAFLFLSLLFAGSNLALKFICPVQSAPHIFLSHVLASLGWILLLWIPVRKKFSW